MIKEIYNNIYNNKELFNFIFKDPIVSFYYNNLKITAEAVDILGEYTNYNYNDQYEIAATFVENTYPTIILGNKRKSIIIKFSLENYCIAYLDMINNREFIMLPFSNLVALGPYYTHKYTQNNIESILRNDKAKFHREQYIQESKNYIKYIEDFLHDFPILGLLKYSELIYNEKQIINKVKNHQLYEPEIRESFIDYYRRRGYKTFVKILDEFKVNL